MGTYHMLFERIRAKWCQIGVPSEFFISLPLDWSGEDGFDRSAEVAILVSELGRLQSMLVAFKREMEIKAPPVPPPIATTTVPDLPLVVGLCNGLSRLRANLQLMRKAGPESREVRNIQRVIDQVEEDLRSREVEYFDKAGKPFDAGDSEFEPRGRPVVVPGIARSRIGPCECPVVKLKGKIIQQARGLVEVPDSGAELCQRYS